MKLDWTLAARSCEVDATVRFKTKNLILKKKVTVAKKTSDEQCISFLNDIKYI